MKMYDNVLEKVRAYENKKNIVYATVESPSYRRIKILYFLAIIFTLGVNLMLTYGHYFFDTIKFEKNIICTILISSGLMIVGTVVLHFKKHLWTHFLALISNVFSAIGLVLFLSKISGVFVDALGELTGKFYYSVLAPLCILFICTLALTVIALRAHLRTRKT